MKRFQFKIWHLLLAITVVAVFSPMLPYPYDEPQRLTDIEILRALAEKNPKLDPLLLNSAASVLEEITHCSNKIIVVSGWMYHLVIVTDAEYKCIDQAAGSLCDDDLQTFVNPTESSILEIFLGTDDPSHYKVNENGKISVVFQSRHGLMSLDQLDKQREYYDSIEWLKTRN